MFRIINFAHLIRYAAIATTIISILTYEVLKSYFDINLALIRVLSIAPWVALIVILTITTNKTARWIWMVVSRLGFSKYPDLNGSWEGEINTETGIKIPARALIRQTLLETQIDLHTETAKSLTLETTPIIESGQNKLYYKYRSIPKELLWSSYIGSTTFDVRRVNDQSESYLELSGSYFTDRKSIGRVRLRQLTPENSGDVSYY
ncbi:hypothetical protein [Methylobacterium sp. Leaf113]|uniref:Cap15 family cyclic dinucleotide receptor domain-containing protein n=1 Tax=Methylobacterium sp. Leaf113 TaxID=1736259 RepID=UPI0009E7C91B|nr:hypothetical protein [Methylobacterium sp. Leaf113]